MRRFTLLNVFNLVELAFFLFVFSDIVEESTDDTHLVSLPVNNNSTIWVIEEDGKLIGTGTLLYEYKFIRDISKCAHIEDVCIKEGYRGKNYGTLLIDHLITEAQKNNCYKIILDCNSELEKFYAKSGLIKNGIQMGLYF